MAISKPRKHLSVVRHTTSCSKSMGRFYTVDECLAALKRLDPAVQQVAPRAFVGSDGYSRFTIESVS